MGSVTAKIYHQVPATSYSFERYMDQKRWASLWHQVDLVVKAKPRQILEVGVGNGYLKLLCQPLGIQHQSLDLSADLSPDILADVTNIPLADQSVDLTCAFQVLEHLPYQDALRGFQQLCRVSRRDIIISLPNARKAYPFMLTLPFVGSCRALVPSPIPPLHRMIKSHRWEIGRRGTALRCVLRDLSKEARLLKQFRVFENPYHQFFHFRRYS